MSISEKIDYFLRCAAKRVNQQPIQCPNCGSDESILCQRKYLISELRRCISCRLLFRYPTDSKNENYEFYQADYSQGFTTDCPTDLELKQLLDIGFNNEERNYSPYIEILKKLHVPEDTALIDFGCSWGYGTWQLAQAGYNVQGFDISRPRAFYARDKLGLRVTDNDAELSPGADIFFSSHVLEHVPSIHEVVSLAKRLVNPGGLFVSFTPNGSEEFRMSNPSAFHRLWGRVHPTVVDDAFYKHLFAESAFLLDSNPYDYTAIEQWDRRNPLVIDLSGSELMVAAVL